MFSKYYKKYIFIFMNRIIIIFQTVKAMLTVLKFTQKICNFKLFNGL